ncbi:MAG: acyltransferase domain-containing protein, partial [Myxococcota bacterium]
GEASAAHLVIGVAEEGAAAEQSPRILGLAARSSRALRDLVRGALERMQTDADLYGVANDALSRPGFEHRVATPVRAMSDVRTRLDAYLRGDPSRVASGYAVEASVAFVIPPAGAQYVRMTDRLYGSEPAFREALNRCDRALRTVLPRPLLSVLYPALGREVPLDDPIFANPITFSVAFALAELLRSRGVVPGAVLGCGVGELAAAAIAGAVDPEEAVRVAAERGRLLGTVTGEAARVVIGTSEGVARTLLEGLPAADIVALPMPERVVIGGAPEAVAEVVERAKMAGLQAERMVGFPNNTPLVDPILGAFSSAATALRFETPEIGWVSAATGRRTEHADAAHWAATIRGPVRFSQAVETLYSLGCRSFVELSRPTLLPAGERTLSDQPSWWFSALDPRTDDRDHLEEILSSLWVLGAPVERGPGGRFPGAAELPTYPWDRRPLQEEEQERLVAELYRSHEDYEGVWVPELTSGDDEPEASAPEEELELELDPDPDEAVAAQPGAVGGAVG